MAIKKTEIYRSLWQSCDELRGGMDASQYKDYVLTLLFVKYVSDKYSGDPYAIINVPEGGSFADMVRLKGDKEIGDKVNKIIGRLAEENDLKGVIDVADFNDEDKLGRGKEMVDRLSRLVGIFEGLDLSANRAEGDDLLGDAYEYLMRHFATESGKAKGQFYTPAEVSRVMAQVVGLSPHTQQDDTVYDPTCGSGSLLLKVADAAPNGISIYGQEMDNATWSLARMNMILHNHPTAELWRGNTLAGPHWTDEDGRLKTFDYAVANPPFSYKSWSNGLDPAHDVYGRFECGIPPARNGDYAFLLHVLTSLKSKGKGVVVMPHGVLFRGNVEADIRRCLIRFGYIKGIIGLPANLFYGTGIPACLVVLDKQNAASRRGIFMIDASRGFIKDGNKNRLRDRDIHRMVDVFNQQLDQPGYARMVPVAEIEENDFNLNIPRYIDGSESEDIHDLTAHLNGGIPQRDLDALAEYWRVLPGLRQSLFEPLENDSYSQARVPAGQLKAAILKHPEFTAYTRRTMALFDEWRQAHVGRLEELNGNEEPKVLIRELGDDLLARFAQAELIDQYAVYQLLMDYWAETMQDDVYLIVQDGWGSGGQLRELLKGAGQKNKETPDLVVGRKKYKADLIPPELVVARYLAAEQAEVEQLQAVQEVLSQELEALQEEHGGEEGLLAEATTEAGNLTKGALKARLKALGGGLFDEDEAAERALLEQVQKLMDDEATAKKKVKAAQERLDEKLLARYSTLSNGEIRELVVRDKWLDKLEGAVEDEIERVTGALANRLKLLEERYAEPLPQIVDEAAELSEKVETYLNIMGVTW